jgi:hypothetical protein
MRRIKTVYWALIAVLSALAFFLIAAGVRALAGRGVSRSPAPWPDEP